MPPSAPTVVSSPKPTAPRPSRCGRVEHEHRPRGAVGDVERDDRQRQRADGGVPPGPAHALGDVAARCASRSRRRIARQPHPGHQQGAERDAHRLDEERPRHPGGEQRGAHRRADQLVVVSKPAISRALPMPRSPRRRPSAAACRWWCRRRPPRCRAASIATSTTAMLTDPVTSARSAGASTAGAQQVDRRPRAAAGRPGRPAPRRTGRTAARAGAAAAPPSATSSGSLRLRGDQQRPGREADAVAEVADPGRADQPPERRAHASGQHRLDESAHGRATLSGT